jgi:hypothetical protein
MKFPLLFYIVLFSAHFATGQDNSESLEETIDNATRPSSPSSDTRMALQKNGHDEEQVTIKKFDRTKWKEIVGDENYSEELPRKQKEKSQRMRDSTNSPESDGKRLLQKEGDETEGLDDSDQSISIPINPIILNIIFYSLTFGIIGYILFLIMKNISLRPKTKISKKELLSDSSPITDIRELEIDILLREAMASGNYRLAIRIYFLGLLKKLDEDGFIVWKKNKTNRDYLSELFSKQYYFEELRGLTLAYEQVWYGDHTLSTQAYEEIISSFRAINQKINTISE